MKVLVLFGSTSDGAVYEPLCQHLKDMGQEVSFDVISAHRDPEKLEKALKERQYDVVVGGAGLAAHLPGVIASKTNRPVFGIPVKAHFGGLDALFSIFQMPYGVPVISTAPNNFEIIGGFLKKMEELKKKGLERKINIVIEPVVENYEYANIELDRSKEFARHNSIELQITNEPDVNGLNIVLSHSDDFIFSKIEEDGLCIHVPLLDKRFKDDPSKAYSIYERINSSGGLWVGVNNTRNAIASYLKFL